MFVTENSILKKAKENKARIAKQRNADEAYVTPRTTKSVPAKC